MSVDLYAVSLEWLAQHTRRTRNSFALVRHISAGGPLTPELVRLLADIAAGRLRVRYREPLIRDRLGRASINLQIAAAREAIETLDRREVAALLREARYRGRFPETKPEVTEAAIALAAHSFGLKPCQLDAVRYRRARARIA